MDDALQSSFYVPPSLPLVYAVSFLFLLLFFLGSFVLCRSLLIGNPQFPDLFDLSKAFSVTCTSFYQSHLSQVNFHFPKPPCFCFFSSEEFEGFLSVCFFPSLVSVCKTILCSSLNCQQLILSTGIILRYTKVSSHISPLGPEFS